MRKRQVSNGVLTHLNLNKGQGTATMLLLTLASPLSAEPPRTSSLLLSSLRWAAMWAS